MTLPLFYSDFFLRIDLVLYLATMLSYRSHSYINSTNININMSIAVTTKLQ